MNSRPISSDDRELPSSSSSRVSASSRFSRPPTAPYAGAPSSSYDYGNNDNYRAVSPASSRASAKSVSKSGINGRTYEDEEEEELGLSSRSARRTAAKRSSSNSSAVALLSKKDDEEELGGSSRSARRALVKRSNSSSSAAALLSKKGEEGELGSSSRSASRAAAKRSNSNSSATALLSNDVKKDYRLERSRSSSSTASSLSNSGKDRPWRTAASNSSSTGTRATSGTSGYVTANSTSAANHDEDDSSLGNNNESEALNESYDVEVTSDRWSQYETQDLAEESRRATSNAVVDMATRIADRQEAEPAPIMGGTAGAGLYQNDPNNLEGLEALEGSRADVEALQRDGNSLSPPAGAFRSTNVHANVKSDSSSKRSTTDYVKSRLSALVTHRNSSKSQSDYERQLSTSSVKSDHDRVRDEALKMLQIADECLIDSPHSRPTSPASPERGVTTGLFRTAGGGLAMRELHDDEVNKIQTSGISSQENKKETKKDKGTVASIKGLDKFRSPERSARSKFFDGTFTIGSQDEEDPMTPKSPNDETPTSSSWSSRYSVERQLMAITGGLDSTRMLEKMDMLHSSREKTKSARGMYRASGYAMDGSHEEYGDYTRGSSTGVGVGSSIWLWLRGTLWSDDPELNYDGTTQSLVRREKAMQRRRRFRWIAASLMVFMIIVGVLAHMGNHPRKFTAAVPVTAAEGDVDFYVLADEPYDFADTEQLTRELEALRPAGAEFVVHLGNANGNVESMCEEYGFERAAAVLRESPVPVLVIPGDKDWAACGSRKKAERALEWWDVNLGRFVRHWKHPLKINYSKDVVGNFAFLHKDVLFISVSIVDAETEPNEVTFRQERNVRWTKEKLAEYGPDGYRALVIFGHAPPSDKQDGYFAPVIEEVKDSNKPVLYLHANSAGSFEEYAPFAEAENFRAVQLEQRGREAPMRVVVREDGKDDAFVFERRDPTMERIQK